MTMRQVKNKSTQIKVSKEFDDSVELFFVVFRNSAARIGDNKVESIAKIQQYSKFSTNPSKLMFQKDLTTATSFF